MSVKPIQDDVPVSEVGQTPNVDKVNIDSQILPLPPMTMGEFEDLVGSIVQDSTSIDTPKSINIDEPIISLPNNLESSGDSVTSFSLQDAISTVSGLESRVMDALAQMEAKSSANSSSNDSGLTTRDYVDQVLGGERNLEGGDLVEAGNFLGKEEGITFEHDAENNTFDMKQDGEVIQSDMTPREANDWVAEKEQLNASSNDEGSQSVANERASKDLDADTKFTKDEDIATGSAQPFPFAQEYMIIVAYKNGTDYYDLFEELDKAAFRQSNNGDAYIECDVDSSGEITTTRFIGNPTDSGLVPFGTTHEMCVFDDSGSIPIQTKAYIPVIIGSIGKIYLVNHSGIFSETTLCKNGRSYVYPMRS